MKAKIFLASPVLLIISALAVYVFAQSRPDTQYEERQTAARRTVLIDKQVITLLQATEQRDEYIDAITRGRGKVAYVQIPPTSLPSSTAFRNATLRIEMMDGSVQEIPLFKVNQVTIEQQGNIR